MWAVFKSNPKQLELMKKEISNKLKGKTKYYSPQIQVQHYLKNKLVNRRLSLLGDYIFCYNESFNDDNILNTVKFTKGLKYVLQGHNSFQKDIERFIELCKKNENKNGFLNLSFMSLKLNVKYKFVSGPFSNKIFEIIKFQKNKIDIILGQIKTSINRKQFLFNPI